MAIPTHPPSAETPLQKEEALFSELFAQLGNAILNRIFDLRPEKAARRMQYLILLFFVSGFLISLQSFPLILWAQYIQDIFLYLFNPAYAAAYIGDPFTKFASFLVQVVTDAHTLQYLPIFLAPFFIALQSAAIYLADVFELEDVAIARSFVWEVALTGSDETIRITKGEISDKHRESPNYLIGGPGKVIVDLDSVALFERANGTPHVIGPTGKDPGGKATLEGFERFRQAIDIRDQYVDLRDQDPKSQSVKSRSRDGIPITATDVRLMFSVYRGEGAKPSPESPYPFDKEAIERIIYKATSRVTPELINPSTYEFSWINNMIGLIRGKLGGFMAERNLTVYLASIGMPEFEKAKEQEDAITQQVRQLTQPTDELSSKSKDLKPPPDFTPRYKITNLFSQFADEFTKNARNSGVELHWIGVGSWKTDVKVVPDKHLDAWILTQDNLKNGNPDALSKVEGQTVIKKMEALIRNVPLAAYDTIMLNAMKQTRKFGKPETRKKESPKKHGDDKILSNEDLESSVNEVLSFIQDMKEEKDAEFEPKDPNHLHDMQSLLLEYRKQFVETVELIRAKKETPPQNIEDAIKHIDNQIAHWAGRL